MAMTLRELWVLVLDHLPFREESRLLEARAAIDEHFPPEGDTDTEEPAPSNVTQPGVKTDSGAAWQPDTSNPNAD